METIMVQENVTATLVAVSTALQMEGFRVCDLTAQNENMLDMIGRNRPKLVLLDSWLTDYSSKQICHRIKAHFPNLPVIALSCDNHIETDYRLLDLDNYQSRLTRISFTGWPGNS